MDTRVYKKTNEQVSLLGFGCMRFPVIDGKAECIDKEKARQMLDYALAHGVTYFDTAYPYHRKTSEAFVGEALAPYPRDKYFLATKMPLFSLEKRKDVDRIFHEQLRNCRTDYFDFYLMHSMNEELLAVMEKFKVYAYLKKKQAQGKIRHLGFSFHGGTELLERLVTRYEFDFGQLQLNYMDWELQDAERQYEILTQRNIPVIVMEPVRGGGLASLCEKSREILRAAEAKASVASWAMRYCASLPNVLTILSGMTTMEQLKDNIATLSGFKPLTQEEQNVIQLALDAFRAACPIPCTACGYCMECPSGVDIPRVFGLHNGWLTSGDKIGYSIGLEQLGPEKMADRCTDCGHCVDFCPQMIDIPERMAKITEELRDMWG
ncbi:MAG: aldo/keto reductase [Peptococcaceae bacterium]|nr:aldo/keto reductase [Peptococcaceae bacterium]